MSAAKSMSAGPKGNGRSDAEDNLLTRSKSSGVSTGRQISYWNSERRVDARPCEIARAKERSQLVEGFAASRQRLNRPKISQPQ